VLPSRYDAGTVYVASDSHRIGDYDTHIWASSDFGATFHVANGNLKGEAIGINTAINAAGQGLDRWGSAHATQRRGAQTRRKTSVPLVPPKPKLFFSATSIFIGLAVLAQ
jgi:hypothetical protein